MIVQTYVILMVVLIGSSDGFQTYVVLMVVLIGSPDGCSDRWSSDDYSDICYSDGCSDRLFRWLF